MKNFSKWNNLHLHFLCPSGIQRTLSLYLYWDCITRFGRKRQPALDKTPKLSHPRAKPFITEKCESLCLTLFFLNQFENEPLFTCSSCKKCDEIHLRNLDHNSILNMLFTILSFYFNWFHKEEDMTITK